MIGPLFFRSIFVLLISACSFSYCLSGFGGAGIIPYAFKDGRVYVLLGQDTWTSEWSNFGGGFDACRDQSPEDTAAREGFEETMGVFFKPKKHDPHPERNEAGGIAYFKEKFDRNFTIYRNGFGRVFFVEVPYVEASHFRRVIHRLYKRKVDEKFLEKGAFAWVRLSYLKKAIDSKNPFVKISRRKNSLPKEKHKGKIILSTKFLTGLIIYTECKGSKASDVFERLQTVSY